MPANPDQVSVPLPPDLRAFVERRAEQEERSIAFVIRRLIADAARQERPAGPTFNNPALPVVTPETLDRHRSELAGWEAERKALQERDCPHGQMHIFLTAGEAQRLDWLNTAASYLTAQIQRVERMTSKGAAA
jgi:hypothetical protein